MTRARAAEKGVSVEIHAPANATELDPGSNFEDFWETSSWNIPNMGVLNVDNVWDYDRDTARCDHKANVAFNGEELEKLKLNFPSLWATLKYPIRVFSLILFAAWLTARVRVAQMTSVEDDLASR